MAGQAGAELLVVLGIGFVIVLAIITSGNENLGFFSDTLRVEQGREAVNRLAEAADAVYAEGSGSTRRVWITVPESFSSTGSYIGSPSGVRGAAINLRIYSGNNFTDVATRTKEDVLGTWPSAGSQWMYVVAQEGWVQIANTTSAFSVEPTLLHPSLLRPNSTVLNLTITNLGPATLSVNSSLTWSPTEVTVTPASQQFTLDPSSSANLTMNITASSTALGTYTGSYNFTDGTSTLFVSLIVEVYTEGTTIIGGGGAANVTSISLFTYSNSSYSVQKQIFEIVDISGTSWGGSAVSINITNSTNSTIHYNSSVPVSSATFYYAWNPTGSATGTYYVRVNDSAITKLSSFSISGSCP